MPNVTKLPLLEKTKLFSIAFLKLTSSAILWSEESISKVGSSFFSKDFIAANAIAGAVFLPTGSKIIELGLTLISLICSATINL